METVSAECSAVAADLFAPQKKLSTDRIRRAASRSKSAAMYGRLIATYHHYTHEVPEDSFPTFLESQLLDQLVEERVPDATGRGTVASGQPKTKEFRSRPRRKDLRTVDHDRSAAWL